MEARRTGRKTLASTAVVIIGGSSYFSMVAGVLRSVLVMRLVGPAPQGLRRGVDLALKYLSNSHLGILHGLNKVMPIHLGRNEGEQVQEVEDVGVTWVLGLTLLAALAMLAGGFMNPTGQRVTSIAIMIGAGTLLVNQTCTLYRTIARTWGHFKALGIVAAVETITTFVFTILGAYAFYRLGRADQHREYAVLGAMLGALLAGCASLMALNALTPLHVRLRLDPAVGFRLLKAGLPIAGIILADTLLRTLDGALIFRYYRAYHFGLYSMAMQMAAYLYAIPEAAGFVIWPKILEAYGAANGDHQALRRQIVLPTLVSGMLMPAIAGMAYIMLPPVISAVLPKFVPALSAAQVLALASVFLALPMATDSLLIAHNRELQVVLFKLVGAGATGLGCMMLIGRSMTDLTAFAVVASFGYAVAAVLSVMVVLPQYEKSGLRRVELLFGTFSPFVWACLALLLSRVLGSIFMFPDGASFVWAILRLVIFLGLMLPVLVFAEGQTHLMKELKNMVNSWKRKDVA